MEKMVKIGYCGVKMTKYVTIGECGTILCMWHQKIFKILRVRSMDGNLVHNAVNGDDLVKMVIW